MMMVMMVMVIAVVVVATFVICKALLPNCSFNLADVTGEEIH